MTYLAYRRAAAIVQAAIIAGLPFVMVGGESALRFDIPSMRLMFFGSKLWVGEMHFLLVGTLLFVMLIIAATLVLGRVWCGWACPQTVLGEFVSMFDSAINKALPRSKTVRSISGHAFRAALGALVSANIIWYFISPYDMLPELFGWKMGHLTTWIFTVQAVAFYLNFVFLGHRFCKTVCPYAKMQGVLLDRSSLAIAFDRDRAEECMGCDLCVKRCPVGIDIKDGPQIECINCAQCIDACSKMTATRGGRTLVDYAFGTKGGRLTDALTYKAVFFICVTITLLSVLVYMSATRAPYTITVVRDTNRLYRKLPDGSVANAYTLFVGNRGMDEATFRVSVGGHGGLELIPAGQVFMVGPGGRREVSLLVRYRPTGAPDEKSFGIEIGLTEAGSGITVSEDAGFVLP